MSQTKSLSKVLIIINVILIPIILLVVLYMTTLKGSNPFTPQKEYPFSTTSWDNGKQIGSVVVNLDDLDKAFVSLFDDTPENRKVLANWELAAESLSADAVLQSEGIAFGIYGANGKTDFDSALATQAEEFFNMREETISGESITIWFQTDVTVDYDVEKIKSRALSVIANYRELIDKGSMTVGQAAEEISTLDEFKEVNPGFPNDLYKTFEDEPFGSDLYQDSTLTESLWDYKAGEISQPLIGRQYNKEGVYESYYTIVYISKHDDVLFESAQDLVQARFSEGQKLKLQ